MCACTSIRLVPPRPSVCALLPPSPAAAAPNAAAPPSIAAAAERAAIARVSGRRGRIRRKTRTRLLCQSEHLHPPFDFIVSDDADRKIRQAGDLADEQRRLWSPGRRDRASPNRSCRPALSSKAAESCEICSATLQIIFDRSEFCRMIAVHRERDRAGLGRVADVGHRYGSGRAAPNGRSSCRSPRASSRRPSRAAGRGASCRGRSNSRRRGRAPCPPGMSRPPVLRNAISSIS